MTDDRAKHVNHERRAEGKPAHSLATEAVLRAEAERSTKRARLLRVSGALLRSPLAVVQFAAAAWLSLNVLGLGHALLGLREARWLLGAAILFWGADFALLTSLDWGDATFFGLRDVLRQLLAVLHWGAVLHPLLTSAGRAALSSPSRFGLRVVTAAVLMFGALAGGAARTALVEAWGLGVERVTVTDPDGLRRDAPTAEPGEVLIIKRGAVSPETLRRGDLVWVRADPPLDVARRLGWRPERYEIRRLLGVQRVIGLPGDTVSIGGKGPVSVNGVALEFERSLGRFAPNAGPEPAYPCSTETNAEGRRYALASERSGYRYNHAMHDEQRVEVTVPPGQVFVLRDFRNGRGDSQMAFRSWLPGPAFLSTELVTDLVVENRSLAIPFANRSGGAWHQIDYACAEIQSKRRR